MDTREVFTPTLDQIAWANSIGAQIKYLRLTRTRPRRVFISQEMFDRQGGPTKVMGLEVRIDPNLRGSETAFR